MKTLLSSRFWNGDDVMEALPSPFIYGIHEEKLISFVGYIYKIDVDTSSTNSTMETIQFQPDISTPPIPVGTRLRNDEWSRISI